MNLALLLSNHTSEICSTLPIAAHTMVFILCSGFILFLWMIHKKLWKVIKRGNKAHRRLKKYEAYERMKAAKDSREAATAAV
jgi:hypothetical protein